MNRCPQCFGRALHVAVLTLGLFDLRAAPLTWFPAPALNSARSGAAVVAPSAGRILLLGGSPVDALAVLSYGAANLQPIDTTRIAPGAAALTNGLIALYGGKESSASDSVMGSVISYDPAGNNDNLPPLPSMSTPRYELGYARDGAGGAYAIGGVNDRNQALASVERYDPGTNGWAPMAGLPSARFLFPAVFDGTNTIYAFGGRTNTAGGSETGTVLRYAINSNAWAAVASMPVATAGSCAALGPDGRIYVIGGTANGGATNLVQVYDPGADSWALETPLPASVSAASAAVDGSGRLVVMGGLDANNTNVATVWRSQQLNVPDSVPVFTSQPGSAATYQVPYTYTATATGNPQPTYSLLTAPAGMSIDAYSGLLTWAPAADQMGTNAVAIQAANYAGNATQTFVLTAVGPPPSTPTGFVASAINDTSITLSWSSATGGLGPITYHLYRQYVVYQPKGGSRRVTASMTNGITGTSITLDGLVMGSSHTYLLAAVASGAQSLPTPSLVVRTTAPQSPANLRVTGLTVTSVSLSWDPSPGPTQDPSYSAITSYSILERVVSVSPAMNVPAVTGVAGTNGTVTGLAPGSVHLWGVQAFDAAGNGSLNWPILIVTNLPSVVTNASQLANGGFRFAFPGVANRTNLVWATANLLDPSAWVLIGSVMSTNATVTFTDTNAWQFGTRFYRVQ